MPPVALTFSAGRKYDPPFVQHPVIQRECGKLIRLVLIRFSLPFPDSVYRTSRSQTTFSFSSCPSKILYATFLILKKKMSETLSRPHRRIVTVLRSVELPGHVFLFFNWYCIPEALFQATRPERLPMLGAVPQLFCLRSFTTRVPNKTSGCLWRQFSSASAAVW